MRLHTRILLMTTCLAISIGLVSALLVSRVMRGAMRRALEAETVDDVRVLAQRVAPAVLAGQPAAARAALRETVERAENMEAAYLVGPDNEVFAHSFDGELPAELATARHEGGNRVVISGRPALRRDPLMLVSYPVLPNTTARVYVAANARRIDEQILDLRNRVVALALSIALLGAIVGILLSDRIVRPLGRLSEAMRSFGEGAAGSELRLTGPREITELVAAFNTMTVQRARVEQRVGHLNAVLQAIRNVNQLIVTEKDPRALLQRACELLVETRGYSTAWIALTGEDGAIAATYEAHDDGRPRRLGPACDAGIVPWCVSRVLAQAEVLAVPATHVACEDCPLADTGAGRGALVTSLQHAGRTYGVLGVALPTELTEDEEERVLFHEVGLDVALALNAIEAQRQWDESAQFNTTIIANAGQGITVYDTELRYVVWNPFMQRLTGLPAEKVLGRRAVDVFPTLRELGIETLLQRALAGEVVAAETVPAFTAEPTPPSWTAATFGPNRNAAGEIVGVIGIITDITARKQAEDALRQQNQTLSAVLDASPVGIALYRARELQWANDTFYEMLGREPGSLTGYNSRALYPDAAEYERVGRELYDRYQERGQGQTEARWVRADGTILYVRLQLHVLDPAAPVEGQIVAAMDITASRLAQEALQASEQRFREMAELLPDIICEIDVNLRPTYANRRAFEVFGVTPEELAAGLSIPEFMLDEERDEALAFLHQAMAGGGPVVACFTARRRGGTLFPLEVHAVAFTDAGGQVAGLRAVLRDISARQQTEQSQRMAAIGQLAAGVAHEFNNVLAIISGRAQLAEVTATEAAYRQLLEVALRATARGAEISANLMDFARPRQPRREAIRIEDAIEAALALTAREIQNHDVTVELRPATDPHQVFADTGQLQEVFVNLFINACHAMPRGGTLRIDTAWVPRDGTLGEIVVTVTDTGVGIRAEDLPRVFEPFFTTKGRLGESDVAGTGLGLSVSNGIITALEGTFTVRSREGMGTTFELRLAACDGAGERAEQPVAQTLASHVHSGAGHRILLAEDEDDLREIVGDTLTERGYEVVAVASTGEALAALAAGAFDIIVSDLMMPGGGGQELLRATQSLPVPPPVILVTGRGESALATSLLANGASAYLQKPFSLADLLAKIVDLLGEPDQEPGR